MYFIFYILVHKGKFFATEKMKRFHANFIKSFQKEINFKTKILI